MRRFFQKHHGILTLALIAVFFSVPLAAHASVTGLVISALGYVLYVAAYLFDMAVEILVLKMGGLITGSGQDIALGDSIDTIWKTVRDLVNLTFIFGLVYIGFRTILDAGTDTKKMLISIIVSALLVNFSLFISKGIIDISNITAAEIYKQMNISPSSRAGTPTESLRIGEVFLARMNVTNLILVPGQKSHLASTQVAGSDENSLAFIIGASIFIVIAIFIFMAGAVLLLTRFVALVILMMLSPVAFAATVFPAFKKWSDQWWNSLLKQAFFAPAYLFMLYITLHVSASYSQKTRTIDSIYNPNTFKDGFTALIFFCITAGLMIGALLIAKSMGAWGAARAVEYGKKGRYFLQRQAGNLAFGAPAAVLRNTAGAAASRAVQSQRFQNWAGRSWVGEQALKSTRRVGAASFDARRVAGVGAELGIGEGKAGGFEKKVADKTSQKDAFAQTLRGPRAKEAYAERISGRPFTVGGSANSWNTLYGTMGRANRVVAAQLLQAQLGPLETQEQALQNRESQMSQELATLQAIPVGSRTPQQHARIAVLDGPVTARGSLLHLQNQLANITAETTRIRGLITANGLENPDPYVEIVNPVTGSRRPPRADEQHF